MMKSFLEDAVSAAWDQVIDRARRQGPEALRKAELLRRRADLMRDHAFPAVVAEIYRIDLEIENQPDTDATLTRWLRRTCPADLRAEAREEIETARAGGDPAHRYLDNGGHVDPGWQEHTLRQWDPVRGD